MNRPPPRPIASPSLLAASSTPALTPAGRMDEARLIDRVLGGDRIAGRTLYDAHAARLHRVCYRLTGDETLAQECTQEAFIRAFQRLDRFRGESALGTWLTRIAVTVTLNALRRRTRSREREVDLDELPPAHAAGMDAEEVELRERVTRAVQELPELYRTVVVLHDIEGYTHAEIAGLLGVPEGTCKTRLFVARRKLRAVLADYVKE